MKWPVRIGLGNDSAKETFGLLEIPAGLDQLAEVRHGQAHGLGVVAPLDRFPQDLLVRLSGEFPRRIGVTSHHHVQAPDRCLMHGHAVRGVDHGLAERCQPSHRPDITQPNVFYVAPDYRTEQVAFHTGEKIELQTRGLFGEALRGVPPQM
jgi:hypothetical protein